MEIFFLPVLSRQLGRRRRRGEVREIQRGMFIFWERDKRVLYLGDNRNAALRRAAHWQCICGRARIFVCVRQGEGVKFSSEGERTRGKEKLIGCKLHICFLPVNSSGGIKPGREQNRFLTHMPTWTRSANVPDMQIHCRWQRRVETKCLSTLYRVKV